MTELSPPTETAATAKPTRRAAAAWYIAPEKKLAVRFDNGTVLWVPIGFVEGLRDAPAQGLEAVTLSPGGGALRFTSLGFEISAEALLQGIFGSAAWLRKLEWRGQHCRAAARPPCQQSGGWPQAALAGGQGRGRGRQGSRACRGQPRRSRRVSYHHGTQGAGWRGGSSIA